MNVSKTFIDNIRRLYAFKDFMNASKAFIDNIGKEGSTKTD